MQPAVLFPFYMYIADNNTMHVVPISLERPLLFIWYLVLLQVCVGMLSFSKSYCSKGPKYWVNMNGTSHISVL